MNSKLEALQRKIETLQAELNIYEKFVEYNELESELENFIDNMDQLNKDENNLYWYEFWLRGFSLGCQPRGYIEVNHNKGRWGIIAYDRKLSDKECEDYDLKEWIEVG